MHPASAFTHSPGQRLQIEAAQGALRLDFSAGVGHAEVAIHQEDVGLHAPKSGIQCL